MHFICKTAGIHGLQINWILTICPKIFTDNSASQEQEEEHLADFFHFANCLGLYL